MRFEIEKLREGTNRLQRREELSFRDLDGLERRARVSAELELRCDPRRIDVRGAVEATVDLECHRCAEVFEQEIEGNLQLVVFRGGSPEEGMEDEDEVMVLPPRAKELDLAEPIRESILLELPMRILCSETCRGLCPGCGANLNHESCTCKREDD
jgi:uncharacterized protein